MSTALEVVIAVVLVALGAALIPLLLQLRRTAQAVEQFARSAEADLKQVAEDVHATRMRVEKLADLATQGLEHPGPLGQAIFGIVAAMPAFFQGRPKQNSLAEILVTGLRTALSFLRGLSRPAQQEAPHE